MPNNFKNHSLKTIEDTLSQALTKLFGEETFVAIEQMEMTGPSKKGVKLVAIAGPERRAKFHPVPIDPI